nr:SAM-dependent methyltransferase [Candidimonas humi]
MRLALYEPGLGYYAAGNTKFGSDKPTGDFATAPELTPLFGRTLAMQAAEILRDCGSNRILEFGAGSGALAASVIEALDELGLPVQYQILEISAELRQRQEQRLARYGKRVSWLQELPENFEGCVLANEVLDAMPVTLFRWDAEGELHEIGVGVSALAGHTDTMTREQSLACAGRAARVGPAASDEPDAPFVYLERPARAELRDIVAQRMPPLPGYRSEINLQAEAWVRQMGQWLRRGAALLIDYGFPQHEYYHPQRAGGTLMCHFRHHAHAEPLILAGLQDITAHVDFTAMADAALDGGLEVLGYTSQSRFLLNAGLPRALAGLEGLEGLEGLDAASRAGALAPVQRLVSETEMGELFKVLAVGRGLEHPLTGFATGDRRHRL